MCFEPLEITLKGFLLVIVGLQLGVPFSLFILFSLRGFKSYSHAILSLPSRGSTTKGGGWLAAHSLSADCRGKPHQFGEQLRRNDNIS